MTGADVGESGVEDIVDDGELIVEQCIAGGQPTRQKECVGGS